MDKSMRSLKWTAALMMTVLLVCIWAWSASEADAAENDAAVDGRAVKSTSDPLKVAEHIDGHWQTGEYQENGSKYQLQRIIVKTDEQIADSNGADAAIHNRRTDEYVLEYDSQEDTRAAYHALTQEFGEDQVMLDTLITIDSISIKKGSTNCTDWGTHLMGLDSLKEDSLTEHAKNAPGDTIVAILDTGINAKHEMFRGRIIRTDSKSFIPSASALKDDHGHGSHVAGIVADGTCAHVEFLVLKVMDENGQGGLYNVMQGINYAVEHGANVINLSIGVDGIMPDSVWYQRMEEVLVNAREHGAVVVTAAGNGNGSAGKDITKAHSYPAYSPNTIAVGAIDKKLHHASFSYYGDALDFVSPGKSIKSAWKGGTKSYRTVSGTSMAAPEISALISMVDLYHPDYSPDELYEDLVDHAVDLGAKGKDQLFGYGYVKMAHPENTAIPTTQIGGYTIGLDIESEAVPEVTLRAVRSGKGRFRATWSRGKSVTGYQLRYAVRKSMGRAKTVTINKPSKASRTVTGLKSGKTYYVQVRCYKKGSGGTRYGSWSGIKKVKVK